MQGSRLLFEKTSRVGGRVPRDIVHTIAGLDRLLFSLKCYLSHLSALIRQYKVTRVLSSISVDNGVLLALQSGSICRSFGSA